MRTKQDIKDYKRKYREEHTAEIKEKRKIYYQKNKDKIDTCNKKYVIRNKKKVLLYRKKYREEHKDEIKKSVKKYCDTHKEQKKVYDKQYNIIHKERKKKYAKNRHILNKYGLTPDMYETKLTEQNNRCVICNKEFTECNQPKVDHNHITGQVRDLLCNNCNCVLGFSNDDIIILKNAIKYIKRWNK